jgi:hypothetical protein
MRNTGLAAAIEADLLRQDRQRADITSCFKCGHGMISAFDRSPPNSARHSISDWR